MAKKMISKGLFSGLAGICYGPNIPEGADHSFDDVFETFFADECERSLEEGIDYDLSPWGVPDHLMLWTLCRATVVDSFVLRQFSSDCIEHTGPVLAPGEEDIVAEAVGCARSYATAECNHEMLIETQDKMMSRMTASPNTPEHVSHFFGVVVHTLAAHPDAGAIQCVMNLPRCYDQVGEDSVALQAWMKAAFRQRCQDAGFFDEA